MTLSFAPTAVHLAGTTLALTGVAWQDSAGVWRWTREVERDTGAGRVKATTTHFSDWSLVAGAQLRPPAASVQTGETLTLTAVNCYTAEPNDGLAPLYDCADDELAPFPLTLSRWAVNGEAGGNGVVGTVSGSGQMTGAFTAPAQKPDPAVVAVSVDAAGVKLDGEIFAKAILVASVTVGGASTWRGSFDLAWQEVRGEVTDSFNATGTMEFARPVTTSTGLRFSLTAANSSATVSNLRHTTTSNTCTANAGDASFGTTTLTVNGAPTSEHGLRVTLLGSLPGTCSAAGATNLGVSAAVGNGAVGECTALKLVPHSPGPLVSGTASWSCSLAANHAITATLSWSLTN